MVVRITVFCREPLNLVYFWKVLKLAQCREIKKNEGKKEAERTKDQKNKKNKEKRRKERINQNLKVPGKK